MFFLMAFTSVVIVDIVQDMKPPVQYVSVCEFKTDRMTGSDGMEIEGGKGLEMRL